MFNVDETKIVNKHSPTARYLCSFSHPGLPTWESVLEGLNFRLTKVNHEIFRCPQWIPLCQNYQSFRDGSPGFRLFYKQSHNSVIYTSFLRTKIIMAERNEKSRMWHQVDIGHFRSWEQKKTTTENILKLSPIAIIYCTYMFPACNRS